MPAARASKPLRPGDAVSALKNLGYGGSDAMRAVTLARHNAEEEGEDIDLQSLIRLALKELSA